MSESAAGQVRWGPVAFFVTSVLTLGWLVTLPLWLSGQGLADPQAGLLLTAMMFTPTVAMVATVAVFRMPRHKVLDFLGIWPVHSWRRLLAYLVVAVVLPVLIVVLAALISGWLGWIELDLGGLSGFTQQLEAAGSIDPPVHRLLVAQLIGMPLGALINVPFTIGEELGWRGWLLPALRPLGVRPAMLITGVVWGLWHSPVILLGYNYDRPNLGGVLLMVGGCIAWGVLFGWLRIGSASVWPTVFGHASLNAAGGFVYLLVAAGTTPDLAIAGPAGVVVWVLIGIVTAVAIAIAKVRRSK